ncbi:Phenylacetate 2-hydroxylase [Cytospora mali]|uniref:Phenylacetate 2-hydroxylase n=1 Tax=Cytospora mali TaxID=578113 RepID=A0A194W7E2_CYTMA|nr:Phenylacetate 2-hydroxylase [Valsa mali]
MVALDTIDLTSVVYWFPLLFIITGLVYLRFYYVDFAAIKGIPEIPGGSLVHGHLYQLGQDHATTTERWAQKYGWPIYQIRLGNRRVIFLNGFEVAREWLVTRQGCTIDRPLLYTFHGIVSKTSASTIGSNPWDDRTKKQRRVVGSLTTTPAIKRLEGMLDLETWQMIQGIFEASQGGKSISPHIYQKRLALNVVLMFCYERRFEDIADPLMKGILADTKVISSFRSTNSNAQDYIPYLRFGFFQDENRAALATEVRSRRDQWLAALLEEVKESIAAEKAKSCVASGLLTDEQEKLTKHDVRTILGGLMSGGFETVLATAIAGIAYLASPAGQDIQAAAYQDIIDGYGSAETAFQQAVADEKSPYVAAFVREALRYYPPLHILPPRQTYKDFEWNGVKIPKGVMVLTNAQSANHDPATYGPDAHIFRPERWTDPDLANKVPAPYHFSYGAGSRMCTAVNFSNRILYAIFLRLIVSFKIRQSDNEPPNLHYIDYNCDTTAQGAIAKDFKAYFELRDREAFDACMKQSEENTRDVTNGMVK